jgi:hypothetical protein
MKRVVRKESPFGKTPPYEEEGRCTGTPDGEHIFAIGQLECVFCKRARIVG